MWQVTSGNDDLLPATCDLPPDEPIICVNLENLRPKPKSANIGKSEPQVATWVNYQSLPIIHNPPPIAQPHTTS
jgi:hypothetical protein